MNLKMFVLLLVLTCSCFAQNLAIKTSPYLQSGLYTRPVLPEEGKPVKIVVRAACNKIKEKSVSARIEIISRDNQQVENKIISLPVTNKIAAGEIDFSSKHNGIYTVKVTLDPENKIKESNENDNVYTLILPIVKRKLNFAWWVENPQVRWATCITTVEQKDVARIKEHGVIPLRWVWGGASWRYNKKKAATQPAQLLQELEEKFYKIYSSPEKWLRGFGIDETGGYGGAFQEKTSIASMKALVRAKKKMPERFFAVWHSGGVRAELAKHYRNACDLLLLELYPWWYIPHYLGTDDIYQMVRNRLDPFLRGNDMIVSTGHSCYTLIALSTSIHPDYVDLGEQEQMVRFIRRICPEMRGLAWYTGSMMCKRTKQILEHNSEILRNADRLDFEYYIKPCITLMRESMWITRTKEGNILTVAVSNIGGVDSGKVAIKFLCDGKKIGVGQVAKIPAGRNRTEDRVLMKCRLPKLSRGMHKFAAKIVEVEYGTVLDGTIGMDRMIRN